MRYVPREYQAFFTDLVRMQESSCDVNGDEEELLNDDIIDYLLPPPTSLKHDMDTGGGECYYLLNAVLIILSTMVLNYRG